MLPEIELDVLRYLDLDALEGLQMHSRYLRDLANRHASAFPLRSINKVKTISRSVTIRRREEDGCIEMRAESEDDLELLFRRVNNAFIHRLQISFEPESLPLLNYLRANADRLQCHIKALQTDGAAVAIDYTLVDFLSVHLKPQVYETMMVRAFYEEYAMLFTHDALRAKIKHLVYGLSDFPAPDCIIPELLGVDAVQTCAILTDVDPRPWIRKFADMFESAERGTDVVKTVTLLRIHFDGVSPLHYTFDPLGQPQRTDVLIPHNAFIKGALLDYTEPSGAELFVFENAKLAKKLHVFAWTVEEDELGASSFCHHAFLVELVDM